MRDEFVRRRGWLDDAAFVDLLGASNLIPGPTSSELAMHIGHRRGGWPGLAVAGLSFILPAVLIVAVLAWLYVDHGRRPEVGGMLAVVAPVVVAVIVHAGLGIARGSLRTPLALTMVVGVVIAVGVGVPEIVALLGAGVAALLVGLAGQARTRMAAAMMPVLPALSTSFGVGGPSSAVVAAAAAGAVAFATVAPLLVFLEMARIGAVLFGSGYVIVALFRSAFVDALGWITEAQLLDAVAIGQATPGPLFSTATFVGYLAGGAPGAVAATVGIFAPAFVAVVVSIPVLARLQRSARARAFLDGVNAATVGLLAVVAVQLGTEALVDPLTVVVALTALVLISRGVGSGILIAAAAVLGLVRISLGG